MVQPLPPYTGVVLFRDKSRGRDSYTPVLLEDHVAVESVAVLEHKDLLTAQTIDDVIKTHAYDDSSQFAALVFTSQSAVKALGRALEEWIRDDPTARHTDGTIEPSTRRASCRQGMWDHFISRTIFVVGCATGSACRAVLCVKGQPTDIRGECAGGAAAMLPEVVAFSRQYRAQHNGAKPRLVFFCGDQRRETLPDGLRQSNEAELIEIASYTTVGKGLEDIRRDLVAALENIKATCKARHHAARAPASAAVAVACTAHGSKLATSMDNAAESVATMNCAILIWMVLFSPSGVRAVLPLLATLEHDRVLQHAPLLPAAANTATDSSSDISCANGSDSNAHALVMYRLAAIGATTMDEIVTRQAGTASLGNMPVLAKEPSAQGIRNAIRLALTETIRGE